MSNDANMLVENAALKKKVSALIAERESLVVLNESLAEKNKILLARLRQHINDNNREREEALHVAWGPMDSVQGRGRARAEEWAAIKKNMRSVQHIYDNNHEQEEVQGRGRALAEEWAAIKKNTRL